MLFVADEVQAGMGRTGRLFAIEHYGLVPDLTVSGKSIAGGMPLAAVTGSAEIMDAPHPGGLGGTYSGNPVACAAAMVALETPPHPHSSPARRWSASACAAIRPPAGALSETIGDLRGLGPMLAIELVKDAKGREPVPELTNAINAETLKRGLITIRAGLYGNCLRFLPPLNISDEQIDEGMTVLGEAIDAALARRA